MKIFLTKNVTNNHNITNEQEQRKSNQEDSGKR